MSALESLAPALGTIGAGAIAWLTATQARTSRKLARLARENYALWYYVRHLIDWGYRPHRPGDRPPEPPESIRHLFEFGDAE